MQNIGTLFEEKSLYLPPPPHRCKSDGRRIRLGLEGHKQHGLKNGSSEGVRNMGSNNIRSPPYAASAKVASNVKRREFSSVTKFVMETWGVSEGWLDYLLIKTSDNRVSGF